MKNLNLFTIILCLLTVASCSVDPGKNVKSVPSLISEGFISDTEYEIVCIGMPKEGLKSVQKEESAKRAALLNAYFYSNSRFDDTVKPDVDGKVVKFTMLEDYAELNYVITKSNLKKRLKK